MRSEDEIAEIAESALNIAASCMANHCGCPNAQVGMNIFAYLCWVMEWEDEYVAECVKGALTHYREEMLHDRVGRDSELDEN